MLTIKLLTVSKRKNSTLQPDTSGARQESVSLKAPTSEEAPSFLLNWESGAFPYNYLVWGNHYYWINNVNYERNNLIRLDCTLDVLATYKADILASTQYVAYSSVSGGLWLPDRRIAVLDDVTISAASVDPLVITQNGVYVLTVLGRTGCEMYTLDYDTIIELIGNIQSRARAFQSALMDDFESGSVEEALASLGNVLTQTDLLGNAYDNAVNCIRSCVWVPFVHANISTRDIMLGELLTGVSGHILDRPNVYVTFTVNIPWQYNDWRRMYCEDIYLYLPFVGVVPIDPAALSNDTTQLSVRIAMGYADGNICYEVSAAGGSGNRIISDYGGNCAAQYPIGVNQQASFGRIAQSIIGGVTKTTGALTMGSIPSISSATNAVAAAYDVANISHTTTPTIIGGTGGGAGSKLDTNIRCYSVAKKTVINPGDQAATMGVPTQKPLQLSSCSGYCQCINAHVSAPAHGDSLNAIDIFLNSGFYIE